VHAHSSVLPRNPRVVLVERIERDLHELLEALIQANCNRGREPLLKLANMKLATLRFQMCLGKDLPCLNANSYCYAAKAIDEIGSRVGGWLCSRPKVSET